jgi:hypothetical protein
LAHPKRRKAEDENENEDEGCRLNPTTYYLLPLFLEQRRRDAEVKKEEERKAQRNSSAVKFLSLRLRG